MTPWTVIIAIAVGTVAFRSGLFLLVGTTQLPTWIPRYLAFVAPAALAALVASMTLTDGTDIRPAPTAELAAVIIAFVVTRRTRNLMHAIAIGLPVFWMLDHLLG